MAFIPNGSGLWLPESAFRPYGFSVPDGSGYVRKGIGTCLNTGFAAIDDKLIYPIGPWSVSSAGYWTTPPVSVINISANANVSTWTTGISAIADQWCTAAVTQLTEAGGSGAGIGVMVRVDGSGHGYYGMVAKFGGALRYEAGIFSGGALTAKFVVTPGSLGPITLKAIGNTISFYTGVPTYNLVLLGSFNDIGHPTGVPGSIGSSGSNGHPDTIEIQTNWLAAQIGGC